MKMYVIALRDITTDVYGPPQTVHHTANAIRTFGDQCMGKIGTDQTISLHPEHFELYQLATWDDKTGAFTNDKQQIAVGANYKGDQK